MEIKSSENLVTVILALNRVDEYFDLAINSILSQTHKNIEILIVANGFSHQQIAEKISSKYKDPRIKIITTPIGQLSFALNLGIHSSKGAFIARMDADDISMPSRIEKQLNFIRENNADIVSSDAKIIDEKNNVIGEKVMKKNKKIEDQLFYRNPIIHPSVLYKKDIIIKLRGYNSGFNSEDYDLWQRARREKIIFKNMSEKLIYYRVHTNSTQRKKLAYAEITGLSAREFLLTMNINHLLALIINSLKFFIRGK